jgi:formate dehydrogenase major subunit
MVDRIARLLKDTRDAKLREGNALTAVGVIGGCTDNNENNYLLVKTFRAGMGIIPLEQQARI